ncbi:MAG: biotin--[acetyl-CoA-carboxylase] ligase [Proteobacteria bacterium]|nr:biotin--[acetyl-CoA-carboxylase] ligase [Pseudomonadota bacterium]
MARALSGLRPATRWIGRRIEILDSTDSTNRVCEQLAAGGAPAGTLVVADRQTAGRGRLGRSFFSPPGRGLYLSLLLRPRLAPDALHSYVFAAALAVARCCRQALGPEAELEIKWPNDVLIAGRKTSGINLPAQLQGARVASAVLGVGINLNTRRGEFPPELRDTATSLYLAGGREINRLEFAQALLTELERQLDRIDAGDFPRLLDDWRSFFRMQDRPVTVNSPGTPEIRGTARGVDPSGALLVETPAGPRRILAGDVTLRPKDP